MKQKDKAIDTFRKKLIKMHEVDNNKHALQWFLNDIFELAEILVEDSIKELENKNEIRKG